MFLEDLGYTEELEKNRVENDLDSFVIGRIIAEHKERYVVKTETKELDAEITGNLRYSAKDRSDFPAVGDWVAISIFDDSLAIINKILPRKTVLERKAVGKLGEKQIIATNIDYSFIMLAVDRDFNINRLERYLTISYAANVEPIILLSKIDLISNSELNYKINEIEKKHKNVRIIVFSNISQSGYDEIRTEIKKGKTYCFMGSSGVGKSTLINHLSGKELMKTRSISSSTKKGKHTTSHKELFVLDDGGILIDTPGMREIGIIEDVDETFDEISSLANNCKYNDCTHIHEKNCAIIKAVSDGDIDEASYDNYMKMLREEKWFQSTVEERRKKDKEFGKMVKAVLKNKKQNKY